MGGASWNYPDPERAKTHQTPADQVPFVGNPRFKPSMLDAFAEVKEKVTTEIEPLQIAGGAGDVILTHGRTFRAHHHPRLCRLPLVPSCFPPPPSPFDARCAMSPPA